MSRSNTLAAVLFLVSAAALAAAALLWIEASGPDLSGRWLFKGLDGEGNAVHPLCRVEIVQRGDRADLAALALDGSWTCTGRGAIEGRTFRFAWAGERSWRGTASLTLDGPLLRGTYRREDTRSEEMRCVGERER